MPKPRSPFEDLAGFSKDVASTFRDAAENLVGGELPGRERLLERIGAAGQDELDAVRGTAEDARSESERLAKRVAELEERLAKLEAGPPRAAKRPARKGGAARARKRPPADA